MCDTPTIYEWAGGREAFERWLNVFYDLVEEDDRAGAPLFGGRVSEEHRDHVTAWWCEVMGGPADYTTTTAATSTCWPSTAASAITPEQRLRFVTLLHARLTRPGCRTTRSSAPR